MFTTATMHISTGTHAQLPQALCTSLEQYKLFHSHHMHPVADTFYVLFLVHIIHTRLNCVLWRLAASKQHHKINCQDRGSFLLILTTAVCAQGSASRSDAQPGPFWLHEMF
ncbi:unnamed protein product [Ixodes pacificus]